MGDYRDLEGKFASDDTVKDWIRRRIAGETIKDIADSYHCSVQNVYQRIRKFRTENNVEVAEDYKAHQLARFDKYLAALEVGISCGDPKSIAEARQIDAAIAKLLGLNEAEKHEVTDTTPSHILQLLAAQKAANQEQAKELNPSPSRGEEE